jgi:hypothetical protein
VKNVLVLKVDAGAQLDQVDKTPHRFCFYKFRELDGATYPHAAHVCDPCAGHG